LRQLVTPTLLSDIVVTKNTKHTKVTKNVFQESCQRRTRHQRSEKVFGNLAGYAA
jgi:hypothetical protein